MAAHPEEDYLEIFQFTPLREGRRTSLQPGTEASCYFNSRPCERGDYMLPGEKRAGAYFNSRPCERGDAHRGRLDSGGKAYFNSRPCERGDGDDYGVKEIDGVFQFTPLREGRRQN